jgi:hypothetical protein
MIYLKSSLVGLGAVVAYCVLFALFGVRLLLPAPAVPKWTDLPEGVSFSSNSRWVPIPLWGPLAILAIGLLVFAAAYFWMFRRLRRPRT